MGSGSPRQEAVVAAVVGKSVLPAVVMVVTCTERAVAVPRVPVSVRQAPAPPRRSNSCQFVLGAAVPGVGRALLRMHRWMRAM